MCVIDTGAADHADLTGNINATYSYNAVTNAAGTFADGNGAPRGQERRGLLGPGSEGRRQPAGPRCARCSPLSCPPAILSVACKNVFSAMRHAAPAAPPCAPTPAGHGTHTAGTIGALSNNGVGVAGVAWNLQLHICKFLSDSGSGYTSDVVE